MSAAFEQSPLDRLRRQLAASQQQAARYSVVKTPFSSLNAILPERGLPTGSLIEWVGATEGLRTFSVALRCAASFLQKPGPLVVIDPLHEFYPPSICSMGIPLPRVLLIRPGESAAASAVSMTAVQRNESLWALEQCARCSDVRVAVLSVDRISATAQRRLQLAIESSGVTVFLIRPLSALQQTTWADLRFLIRPAADARSVADHDRVTVELIRSKNTVLQQGTAMLTVRPLFFGRP